MQHVVDLSSNTTQGILSLRVINHKNKKRPNDPIKRVEIKTSLNSFHDIKTNLIN